MNLAVKVSVHTQFWPAPRVNRVLKDFFSFLLMLEDYIYTILLHYASRSLYHHLSGVGEFWQFPKVSQSPVELCRPYVVSLVDSNRSL